MRASPIAHRRAFTLVELLVVIGIIFCNDDGTDPATGVGGQVSARRSDVAT